MLPGLRVGDTADEVLRGWLAKESVRDVYLAENRAEAARLFDKAFAGCAEDEVEEVRALERTLARWQPRSSLTTTLVVEWSHPRPPSAPTEHGKLAELLGITVRHLRRLMHEGRIPSLKTGHYVVFDGKEIAAWLKQCRRPVEGGRQPRIDSLMLVELLFDRQAWARLNERRPRGSITQGVN